MSGVAVATSAAGLNLLVPAPADAQGAIIRIGSGVDSFDIPLTYNAGLKKWIGKQVELMRGQDQLEAQCQPTYTTKQLMGTNTDNPILGGDTLWHFASPWRLDEVLAAGLMPQYRQHAFLLATKTGAKKVNVGACLFPVEAGDERTINPAEAWAETNYMLGGRAWPGAVPVYEWRREGWTALEKVGGGDVEPTSKKSLAAGVYGFMEGGATEGGGFVSYALWLRWVIS